MVSIILNSGMSYYISWQPMTSTDAIRIITTFLKGIQYFKVQKNNPEMQILEINLDWNARQENAWRQLCSFCILLGFIRKKASKADLICACVCVCALRSQSVDSWGSSECPKLGWDLEVVEIKQLKIDGHSEKFKDCNVAGFYERMSEDCGPQQHLGDT